MSLPSVSTLPPSEPVEPARVTRVATSRLPTLHGEFLAIAFRDETSDVEHLAIVKGEVSGGEPVLTRLHSECLTGDALGSLRCDCGQQLGAALDRVAQAGLGVVLYLRGQEGRGIGLANKIRAYMLQDAGRDTVDANTALGLPVDARRYDAAAAMLRDLGVQAVRLLSNNPRKIDALQSAGIVVAERLPLTVDVNPENRRYLQAKQQRLGHMLELDASGADAPR
ncbi:GTP cyclohydrolase II [Chitinasiproducens palmae]|uniref:GTP cyclohydrolase-2 n=1 Tax=Chitinasiproducens palmae TaxID=1770053 RepID=A0A1H2PVV5_9BURK|nr:GTP cyclohydrolase II [Chitinasiproducens palmae]SDV51437.1 GTP cyclohydrolase II [Chitinasiproducens palmae]